MLINLRNALMAGKRLPYDAEVEYLESTGTQYVDTGITPDALDLSVELTLLSKGGHVFGCRNSSNLSSGNIWSAYSHSATSMREDWLLSSSAFAISSTVPNTVTFSSTTNGSSISYDGQTYTGNAKTTYSYSMVLFGVSTAGVVSTGKMVIYACKIWKSGVLVRDYITVRVGQVGYMYDRVSGKLFGNAGTGDFVLGQDVVPVEYIESHGTEYIDTGMPARTGLATDIVCAITQAQNDTAVCGAKGTSNNRCVPVAFFSSDSTTALVYGNGNRDTDSIYAQYYPEVGRMVRYQSAISTGAISLNIDGTAYTRTTQTSTINAGTTLRMFAREWNGTINAYSKIRMASALFDLDGKRVRKYLPIRVGTGSTWEGAMMDVLTRRIYRNQGTGAFGYGNDLPYSIPAS